MNAKKTLYYKVNKSHLNLSSSLKQQVQQKITDKTDGQSFTCRHTLSLVHVQSVQP